MRVIVMFDLPVTTIAARREYTQFRKQLIKSGFFMLQESVYCKLLANSTAADNAISALHKIKPKAGLIQALKVTEKQFANMDFILGESNSDIIDSTERLVIL